MSELEVVKGLQRDELSVQKTVLHFETVLESALQMERKLVEEKACMIGLVYTYT